MARSSRPEARIDLGCGRKAGGATVENSRRDSDNPEGVSGPEESDDALDRLVRRGRTFKPIRSSEAAEDPEQGPAKAEAAGESVRSEPAPGRIEPEAGVRDLKIEEAPGATGAMVLQREGHARPVASRAGERDRIGGYYRLLALVAAVVIGLFVWRLTVSLVANDAVEQFFGKLLSMQDPFRPLPSPDDPIVNVNLDLRAAARVGAPLVLAVLWFVGGFQVDRSARRAFDVRRSPGSATPVAYAATAIGCVFPLLVAGMIGLAWGGFSLAIWTAKNQAWLPTAQLLGLLLAFAIIIRVVNGMLDRRTDRVRRW